MRHSGRVLAVMLLLLLGLACGGGGGNGSPTEPAGHTVFVTLVFGPPLGGGTVSEATLSLDGREIERKTWQSGCAGGCSILVSTGNVRSGQHALALTIVRQSRTTMTYTVLGNVTTDGTGSMDLPRQDVSLRAGQSVTYTIPV